MKKQLFQLGIIGWMTVISALLLFVCSSIRHTLYQSGVLDLGIYDQVVYLISQGQPPISSFLGFHHMGNHAAWAVYPLALLYKIYPSAYWLLAVQAVSLALGAVPTYYLALQAGLKQSQAVAMAAVYLLYPLIFNVNLFEFHPEVMAIPVFLGVVLAARLGKIGWFCLGTIFILGCKAVLSLTVTAMGFWLLVFERRRFYGTFALIAGISWFLIASQVIIPFFSNSEVAAVSRYSYLGDSVIAIASNLLLKPNIVLERVFSFKTLEYLALLVAPLIWGLTPQHLTPLVSAIPALVLNILSDKPAQRDLIHQYSLPILPFLIVTVIASLAADKGWLRTRRAIILWALLAFMVLGKYGYFWSRYLRTVDNWQATTEAIAQVQTKGAVLTTHSIAPHLSHRPMIQFVDDISGPPVSFTPFDYILLNVRHPDGTRNPEFAANLVNQLKNHQLFQLVYQRDDVYLFVKRSQ
ncbi:hypothetical protein CEN41_11540 [Fischerella thermalis CCMEE 5330]|uniref:DUF2079 domain-containing protein n=1 Tax=Fischerella thermalis CCMEE 5330 TaxID=2019670 RepID=A0A2N6MB18_9CYAN|nr:DUF2079 domain-containing protein [Fischerella thermalis]PMB43963.1 hypothetical protein CEN41_11540 [Fischerella thermalis CCMEE 5330]